jgi:hypothetical protein
MTQDLKNREWLNEYPALKQVDQNNPFIVPVGYFEELGECIKSSIKLDELRTKIRSSGFIIPEHYFEELNSNIQSRINIERFSNAEEAGFTVPENYFEELNSNIQSRIFVEEALNIENAGFTVPENYFEQLNSQITSRIFVEEALINAEDTLSVPVGYFKALNKNILDKTIKRENVKRTAKVVRMFSSNAFKYATAACLTIMVGTGIFLTQFFAPEAVHNRSYLHKQVAKIPLDEIQEYLQLNADETLHSVTSDAESASVNDPDLDNAVQDTSNGTQK